MTEAQWMLEYHALRSKEKDQVDLAKTVFLRFQEMLSDILGLNVVHDTRKDKSEGVRPFVPMSLLVGRPEIMQEYLKGLERGAAEDEGAADESFEKLSQQIQAQAEGRPTEDDTSALVPVLTANLSDLDTGNAWQSAEVQAALRALGVKPRPADAPAAVHVSAKPKKPRPFHGLDLSSLSPEELRQLGELPLNDVQQQSRPDRLAELEKFRQALAGEEL